MTIPGEIFIRRMRSGIELVSTAWPAHSAGGGTPLPTPLKWQLAGGSGQQNAKLIGQFRFAFSSL